jgi:hypothetical protein
MSEGRYRMTADIPGGERRPAVSGKTRRKPGAGIWKWTAGIAATVIGSVLVVVFTKWIQPPPPPPTVPPPPMGGTINYVANIPINSCCKFAVNFTLKGFMGRQAHWESAVTDTDTNMTDDPVDLNLTSQPQANEDQATIEPIVPINQPGNYYVSFILLDPNKTELARESSAPFTVD